MYITLTNVYILYIYITIFYRHLNQYVYTLHSLQQYKNRTTA